MDRQNYAQLIASRLIEEKENLQKQFLSPNQIPSFILDNALPEEEAKKISQLFPSPETLSLKKSLKENKYVTSQMNQYPKDIEEITFSFGQEPIIKALEQITGMKSLLPDDLLYAAGISSMPQGCFLNPHLDNSHDLSGKRYRVLNLLYYVSENWQSQNGGQLELWDQGLKNPPRTIESTFNRLVIMQTSRESLHSVKPILSKEPRKCISSYLFSHQSIEQNNYYHATTFHARPGQPVRNFLIGCDMALRNFVGKTYHAIFKKNIGTYHHYKKTKS